MLCTPIYGGKPDLTVTARNFHLCIIMNARDCCQITDTVTAEVVPSILAHDQLHVNSL